VLAVIEAYNVLASFYLYSLPILFSLNALLLSFTDRIFTCIFNFSPNSNDNVLRGQLGILADRFHVLSSGPTFSLFLPSHPCSPFSGKKDMSHIFWRFYVSSVSKS
jgi:hypothetical protein